MLYEIAREIDEVPKRVISWVYPSNTPRQHRDIAFFGINPDLSKAFQDYKNQNDKRIRARIEEGKKARIYDWWQINQIKNVNKEKSSHPCQMPEEVMDRIMKIIPEGTIIDPFMGSGTTGISAINNGRDFIGIEIDKQYCELARKRIEEGTAQFKIEDLL